MADPDADQDLSASPTQRRSSRPKPSSLSNDAAREPSSTDPTSKRSKVSDKASSAKSISAPIITDTLRVNTSLLVGKKLKKYFSGFGGALGTVTEYILDQDAYRLEYSDGHVDVIPFNDILRFTA
jgi:hypothetical protein